MSDDPAGTPYAHLDPETVIRLVEATGLRSDARILQLNSYENRVYQVGVEDATPIVVKFYRPGRWSDAQILEEHVFTAELAELEIPAVPPLAGPHGSTLHVAEGLRYAIYPRQGGRAPDVEDFDALMMLGRYLGRIHRVGQLRRFAERPTFSVDEFGRASRDFLLASGFIPEELRPAYETITADLLLRIERDYPPLDQFQRLRLHGDCHMGNVLWREGVPHFVDFDDARNGPAMQDLWMLLSGERSDRIMQLSEVLEGYAEFCEFDLSELRLVEPLRTLRILHHAAWIGRRWTDPAFPRAFPFFTDQRFWSEHVLSLREQLSALDEPALEVY
ncbi:MAG: serine/threonine protein kinase [Pseudomonadales bacterium]|jgi:Ser/Thr protein kinase RdoA (MazF antagonist)|nr:serine/threonine protein kinase [Pseudomonadales bacterium]